MAKFVLIDHSLGGIGGHHYDYAVHVLRAADAAGYETVLAANRRFRNRGGFPISCRLFPLFRYHTYSKYTLFAGSGRRLIDPSQRAAKNGDKQSIWQSAANFAHRPWKWLGDIRHRNGPQRRIDDFSLSFRRLFRKVTLAAHDQVFVPTLSEIDLTALAEHWKTDPRSKLADWHLQFHFNIFDGREPDYPAQQHRLEQLREHLQQTLQNVAGHRLHFYNTTQQLAAQYNRMEVARFEPLPYPVNEALFRATTSRVARGPLRVTCAGGSRTEKGFDSLAEVAGAIESDLLAGGQVQLLVQSKPARLSKRPRLRLPVSGNDASATCVRRPSDADTQPVVYVRYPLKIDDYVELVRRADIGLFLYDSERYYVRRAGIMGEFLSAGVPVIVPAGCWLSEQVAPSIYEHLERLRQSLPTVSQVAGDAVDWRRHSTATASPPPKQRSRHARGGTWNVDQRAMQFGTIVADRCEPPSCGGIGNPISSELPIPEAATDLLVSFRRSMPAEPGTYVRIVAEQFDKSGHSLVMCRHILGHCATNTTALALINIDSRADSIRVTWNNAYGEAQVALEDIHFEFVNSTHLPGGSCASGAVGLVAADAEQVPRLLREMVRHYDHYRSTADVFSNTWNEAHAPSRTIAALENRARQSLESHAERAA